MGLVGPVGAHTPRAVLPLLGLYHAPTGISLEVPRASLDACLPRALSCLFPLSLRPRGSPSVSLIAVCALN